MPGRFFFIFSFILNASPVFASPFSVRQLLIPSAEPQSAPYTDIIIPESLELSHDMISNEVLSIADSLDSVFRKKAERAQKVNPTVLRLSQDSYVSEQQLPIHNTNVSFDLRLPSLEAKGQEIVDSFSFTREEEVNPGIWKENQREQKKHAAQKKWEYHFQPGVTVGNPTIIFGRARLQRDFDNQGPWIHRFREEVTWRSLGTWDETTLFTSDTIMTKSLLFRFLNQKDWTITGSSMQSHHGPSLIYQINDVSGLSYDTRMNLIMHDSAVEIDSYSMGFNYTRTLVRDWMFLQVAPGYLYPHWAHFAPVANIYVKLDFVFGAND